MTEVQTTEDEFQQHLRDFHELFHSKKDAVHLYTAEVVKICNVVLSTANIRHTPITSRVKSWDSAKGSVMRRQQDRLMYSQISTLEPLWIDYCRSQQLDQTDFHPFQSGKEMFESLHDIGGVRIPVYFPGDVDKVVDVLKTRLRVFRVTKKGQNQPSSRFIKALLNELNPTAAKKTGDYERTFGGYKATHVVVGLQEIDIPEAWQDAWKDIVVEIQLGTLVMHMWSEIEHDMIYKPLESQGNTISEDEKRVLDLINGIVMTGEAALRQLEISTTRRLDQRAKNPAAFASSQHELVLWIENYYKEKGQPLVQGEWELLDKLYEVLQAKGDHQHGKVDELLERIDWHITPNRQELPARMLECAYSSRWEYLIANATYDEENSSPLDARLWGMKLIQSLNVAIYLGVGEQFVARSGIKLAPPLFTRFLDLMHPYSPYPVDFEHAIHISNYCRRILMENHNRDRLERVAIYLSLTGRIYDADSDQETCPVLVPGMLSRLFRPHEAEVDPSGTLGFIHECIAHGQFDDDKTVLWDRLTSSSRGQAGQKPIEQCVFVSQAPPWEGKGAWKLENRVVENEAMKWDFFEREESPVPDLPAPEEEDDNNMPGIVGLACRLYPKTRWSDVRKAWKVADALRPTTKPTKKVLKEENTI